MSRIKNTREFAMRECAEAHRENGDHARAKAIECAILHGRLKAVALHPESIPAIDNAIAYARQEAA